MMVVDSLQLRILTRRATTAALVLLATTYSVGCGRRPTSKTAASPPPQSDSADSSGSKFPARSEYVAGDADKLPNAVESPLEPVIVRPEFDRSYRGFGSSVALSDSRLAVGIPADDIPKPGCGSVCLFERQADRSWRHVDTLRGAGITRPVGFAHHVALGERFLAVTAYADPGHDYCGCVYVFEPDDQGKYRQTVKLYPSDPQNSQAFGSSLAAYENRLIIGAYQDNEKGKSAGAAYMFERSTAGQWVQQAKLIGKDAAPGDNLGEAVALFGDHAAVSSRHHFDGQGCVYVFGCGNADTWEQQAQLQSPTAAKHTQFGKSLAMHADSLLVGHWNSNDPVRGGGEAHLFLLNNEHEWEISATIRSDRPAVNEAFGFSVAMNKTQLLAGTYAGEQVKRGDTIYVYERKEGTSALRHRVTSTDARASRFFGMDLALSDTLIAVGDPAHKTHLSDEADTPCSGAVFVYDLRAAE